MNSNVNNAFSLLCSLLIATGAAKAQEKQVVKAIYIPLADHYAGIIAYEEYRTEMKLADWRPARRSNWTCRMAQCRPPVNLKTQRC